MADVITGLADADIDTEWRHEKASVADDDATDPQDHTDGADDADGVDPDEGPADSDARPDRLLSTLPPRRRRPRPRRAASVTSGPSVRTASAWRHTGGATPARSTTSCRSPTSTAPSPARACGARPFRLVRDGEVLPPAELHAARPAPAPPASTT